MVGSCGLFPLLSFFFFLSFSRVLSSRKGCRRAPQPRRALIASACSGDAVKSLREWSAVLTRSCWPAAPAAPRSRHALPLAAAKGAAEAPPKDRGSARSSAACQRAQGSAGRTMRAHLPKQHSCGRGSEGPGAGRNVPPVARDAHCACHWHQHPPGLQHSSQALPSWGPGGASQSRSKCVHLRDAVRKSPHKSSAKPQGSPGEWWSECACARGWAPPLQVSQFFPLQGT